ncbi:MULTISPECIES: S41 family peptidase [unclassified Duganella]|uniref:S41 family peptidase n=1 Tax=unclassified Duganella TaxID=2636909 RepID=UPI0006FCF13A|nr:MULTISPECIES: S41 family peptidase [unclassified Duganella]KQV47607.1 hypothetical protein ASD07_11755 [Duganella sp. Root336D2]KRB82105.1 hypothetical protein ASE26_14525 [Duganella sp. Root198D2]
MRLIRPAILALLVASTAAMAQDINHQQRTALIDKVVKELDAHYVYPAQLQGVGEKLRATDFNTATTEEAFADALTERLRELVRNRHLGIMHDADGFPGMDREERPLSDQERAQMYAQVAASGYGIERVERLPGNVGYFKTKSFAPGTPSAPAVAKAMTSLADTEALIIDLRDNGGGSRDAVPLLASYLFDKPARLNDLFAREGNKTIENWTSKEVAGKRFGGTKPVYILASQGTYSAAEDFIYALKNLKRAVIIGETTKGGASPAKLFWLDRNFAILIPQETSISPVTRTNWEGVGIAPDIAVPAADALQAAQAEIRKRQAAAAH